MKIKHRFLTILCIGVLALSSAAFAGSDRESEGEVYLATATPTNGIGVENSVQLKIHIDSFSSVEEQHQLLDILRQKGRDAMRARLEDLDHGSIAPTGQVGFDINYVTQVETPHGKEIEILMARPLSFLELVTGARSRDYEFTLLSLQVDRDGKGTGTLTPAARISFDEEEGFDIDTLEFQPWRLQGVRRVD